VSKVTISARKAKYGGLEVSEASRCGPWKTNSRLKRLMADLGLEQEMLKAVIQTNGLSS
jgi:hypothetical protein